jgi:hypothetical protein
MQRFMKWRYGAALIIATLAVVACSEATKNPVEPGVTVAAGGPAFLQQGDVGQCMGDDAVQFDGVPGFGTDPTAFNCTANDVRIANARTLSGTPINCTQGQNIVVDVVADVVETSTSARTDIGIWIANAGGTSAETGSCAFFFLPVNGGAPIENLDGDACGDLEEAATVTGFSLSALNLVCDDPDHDGFISIPSCVSWTEPGGDRVCNGTITGGERAGTLPGNKSKCNCEPFQVAINIQGTLTLKKVVVNDNGGSATATSFGITTSAGTPVTFGAPVTVGTTSTYTSNTFSVNTGSYTFSESDIAGYDEGTWSCTGAVASGTAFNAGSVTVPSGTNVVCTITNNDQAAHLIVIKHVINDNGGTAVASAFTNTIGGVTAVGGQAVTGAESPGVDKTLSTVGAYTVTEGAHVGYTVSYSTDCNGTIALGETKTCTVTNDDQPATLIVKKIVIGDGATFDFTGTGTGITPSPFTIAVASNSNNTQTFSNISAGTKTITELAETGYLLTDLGCTTNDNTTPDGVIYDPALTSTVSTTLTLGGTVTCTFINEQVVGQTTRTQGFWSTHLSITHAVWFGGTSGGIVYDGVSDNLLCGKAIDTDGKLMGAFWSNISQTSTKTKRSSLDQARMRLLQQLIAAELNHEAFGSSPTGSISIADAEAAYCGTDIDAINAAASAMAAFNESGDSGVFTPGASANGKTAKTAANVAYWDILP